MDLNKFVKGKKNCKFYVDKSEVVADKIRDTFGKIDNVIFV